MSILSHYTDKELLEIIASVKSIAGMLEILGMRPAGGNYNTIRALLARLKADTSHWTGQGWLKYQQLKNLEDYKRQTNMKKHLIFEREHKCENCNLTEWLGQPITLELEHTDGNKYNNDRSNLKLLCPNCHSQTSTWRGRKNKFSHFYHQPHIKI